MILFTMKVYRLPDFDFVSLLDIRKYNKRSHSPQLIISKTLENGFDGIFCQCSASMLQILLGV